jgi:hypothetical protein
MRQILGELEMTSNAPTQSFNASGGHAPFGSREPTTGDSWAPHERYRQRYANQTDDHGREKIIDQAAAELHRIRHSTAPSTPTESDADRDRRVCEQGEGWEAQIAANHFRLSVPEIRRIRKADGRNLDTGLPINNDQERLTTLERRRKVADLKRRYPGITARQIALHIHASPTTVSEDLKHVA